MATKGQGENLTVEKAVDAVTPDLLAACRPILERSNRKASDLGSANQEINTEIGRALITVEKKIGRKLETQAGATGESEYNIVRAMLNLKLIGLKQEVDAEGKEPGLSSEAQQPR